MDDELWQEVDLGLQTHYFTEIGRFVTIFSLTEAMLKFLLRATVNVDEATALAVFSGTRADAATGLIRRCYEARGKTLPPQLAVLLEQFAILNNLRNDILHHGIDLHATPPISSNKNSVLNPRAVRETVIGRDTLSDASHDLGVIMLGLTAFLAGNHPSRDRMLSITSRHPWLYKLQQPSSTGQTRQSRKPHQGRKRPPRS